MKKKTLILAGILSGSMMLTMGSAMTARAEEGNAALTVAAEETTENAENKETPGKASENAESKEAADKASENAESKEAPDKASENVESKEALDKPSESAENKEAPGKGMPPAFRLRDRSMQPPKENQQNNTNQQKSGNDGNENQPKANESGKPALPDGKTPNENGATGSKATSRFFRPNEKPQTKPDAEKAARDARDPWGTTDKDPYDAEHDPANGEAMKDDRQAMQNENGQPPQGKAPQGEQNQGEAPQGEQNQGEAPQGEAPQGGPQGPGEH